MILTVDAQLSHKLRSLMGVLRQLDTTVLTILTFPTAQQHQNDKKERKITGEFQSAYSTYLHENHTSSHISERLDLLTEASMHQV